MAFIGNTNTTQAFTPAIDYFSGTGSATAFTLSRPVASVAQVQVTIDNVAQNPSSAYTVSGSTITFTSAPLSGTNNIYVYYTSPITQVIAPGQGTVGATALDVYGSSGTGAENLPSGTTAQRPSSPVAGATRFNTSLSQTEYYNGSNWIGVQSSYSVSYLVAAGGGGGGFGNAGGGGAGGVVSGSASLTAGTAYNITVGAGGAGSSGVSSINFGVNGNNSLISGIITAVGGGGGGGSNFGNGVGNSGGSGGGGGNTASAQGGQATFGQGSIGGIAASVNYGGSGGGGGAASTGVGSNGSGQTGGAAGGGVASSITGSSVTYGGGGGGGAGNVSGTAGAGGSGGGGAGGQGITSPGWNGTAGTANTGGGGGGGGGQTGVGNGNGASGGSGIVILSIATTRYTGITTGSPTVTTSGANTILSFTASGTYTA